MKLNIRESRRNLGFLNRDDLNETAEIYEIANPNSYTDADLIEKILQQAVLLSM